MAPVVVVFSRMLALERFPVAKSGLPSPLKSSVMMALGKPPAVKSTLVAKEGMVAPVVVVLRKMLAGLPLTGKLPVVATAKSGLPSPLKSPMLTAPAPRPVVRSTLVAKVVVVAPVVVVFR